MTIEIGRLLGEDPWVAVLVSDPRAALAASRVLRGSQRRIDGPFALWDGKAGTVPVSIFVSEPGGPGAWFAASKLACRRFSPTLLLGVTRAAWCAPSPPPTLLLAEAVVDLASLRPALSEVEATATRTLPVRTIKRLAGASPPTAFESSAPTAEWREAWGRRGGIDSGEKTVENRTAGGLTVASRPDVRGRLESGGGPEIVRGRLGCWGDGAPHLPLAVQETSQSLGALESPAVSAWLHETHGVAAVDTESAGLAEAAGEESVPWFVAAVCDRLDSPSARAEGRAPALSWFRGPIPPQADALIRFLDILRSSESARP